MEMASTARGIPRTKERAVASKLFQIIEWSRKNGEAKAVDRIAALVLPQALKEGVRLREVVANTTCSEGFVDVVRKAAERVVKQRCPH